MNTHRHNLNRITLALSFAAFASPALAQVVQHGVDDSFATGNGAEPASPSAGLVGFVGPGASQKYDEGWTDRRFIDTLGGLPGGIVWAQIEFRVRPNGTSLNSNDTLGLYFVDSSGTSSATPWNRYIGAGNASAGLLTQPWDSLNYPAGQLFTFDLSAMPIASGGTVNLLGALNAAQHLDFIMQDDTGIDFLRLTYQVPEPGSLGLLGLGCLGLLRRSRHR